MTPEQRLVDLGLQLPSPPAPVASYVPTLIVGGLLYVSGQIAIDSNGLVFPGRVGATVTPEDARLAARQCGLNLLAQVRKALGSLDAVAKVVRLGAFIASADDFTGQPAVANGASDLMVDIFGEHGKHVRAAVGVNVLPLGASVEVEAIFALK